jgi:hypothetical protein
MEAATSNVVPDPVVQRNKSECVLNGTAVDSLVALNDRKEDAPGSVRFIEKVFNERVDGVKGEEILGTVRLCEDASIPEERPPAYIPVEESMDDFAGLEAGSDRDVALRLGAKEMLRSQMNPQGLEERTRPAGAFLGLTDEIEVSKEKRRPNRISDKVISSRCETFQRRGRIDLANQGVSMDLLSLSGRMSCALIRNLTPNVVLTKPDWRRS